MRYHLQHTGAATIQRKRIGTGVELVEKLESLYIARGIVKQCSHFGKHFGSS
jgi:hypothetical protein